MRNAVSPAMDIRELDREAMEAKALLANLRDIVADDEEWTASIVESETNLTEAIEHAVSRLAEVETFEEALAQQAKALAERKERFTRQKNNIRAAIQSALGAVGLKKLELAAATLTLKPTPPKVIVTEEADIPSTYFEPQPPKLDKRKLAAALKDGSVPGAVLSNGCSTIQIKWS